MTKRTKESRTEKEELLLDLINVFSLVKGPTDSALLLQDLLTSSELDKLSRRLRIAKLIVEGKSYNEIIDELKCGMSTVARVGAWLKESGEVLENVVKQLPTRFKKVKPSRSYYGYGLPQILLSTVMEFMSEKERKRVVELMEKAEKKDELNRKIDEEVVKFLRMK